MIMYRNVHINKQVMGSSNRKKGTNAAIAPGIVLGLLLCSLACSDVLHLALYLRAMLSALHKDFPLACYEQQVRLEVMVSLASVALLG